MDTTNFVTPDLPGTCMLVYCKVGVWSARKLDKKQTQKTIQGANATNDAARVNKHLLANADAALREVMRKAGQIRDYIDTNTLPWDDAGNRLLPNVRALSVVGELRNLETEFWALVDAFVHEYPVLRAQAVTNLGDMGAEEDYPQPDVVRQKFTLRVSFSPIARDFGDVRIGMTDVATKAWQAQYEKATRTQLDDALKAAYGRLRERLEHYSDRLTREEDADKAKVFRSTMVEGLRQTVDLLSSLNSFGGEELARITAKVQREIAAFDADVLRTNVGASMAVKQSVDDVLAKMKAILG